MPAATGGGLALAAVRWQSKTTAKAQLLEGKNNPFWVDSQKKNFRCLERERKGEHPIAQKGSRVRNVDVDTKRVRNTPPRQRQAEPSVIGSE